MKNKKVLIISHDASLSGAPILLIPFLRYIVGLGVEIDILLGKGGPLEAEFAEYGTVNVLDRPFLKLDLLSRFLYFVKRHTVIKWEKRQIFRKINGTVYQGVVSNTIVNKDILANIRHKHCIYVHELKTTAVFHKKRLDIIAQMNRASKLFYPSMAVKNFIENDCLVPENKMIHIPYFFDLPENIQKNYELLEYKKEGFILIGMSGGISLRKGIFPFIEVLNQLDKKHKLNKKFKFVWVGADDEKEEMNAILPLMEKLNISSLIVFQPVTKQPLSSIICLDIFFLSSIEDPYPLVAIEAAMLKKPIICYTEAGGMSEFVQNDAGICVPLYDIEASASAIERLVNNDTYREQLGNRAYEKAVKRHHDVSILERFIEEISSL